MNELWAKDESGRTVTYEVVSPNRWQGRTGCLVGPFSGRDVAEYFAGLQVDFGQFDAITQHVFARGDAWYIRVETLELELDDRAGRGVKAYSQRSASPPLRH
jgi:hypothetical protein